jgi:hypothetical protein
MNSEPSHREEVTDMWIVFYVDDAGRDVRYGAYSLMEHGDDAMERLEAMGRRAGICHETQWEAR